MLGTSEGSSYPSRKHWTKSPQTRFSGRGREQILYKVELRAREAEGREGRSGVTTRLAVLKARNGAFPPSGEPGGCLGQDQSGFFTNSGDHPQADQGAAFADRIQETLTLLRLMCKRASKFLWVR